jgi:putative aldouronate transport system substrate-binding protein
MSKRIISTSTLFILVTALIIGSLAGCNSSNPNVSTPSTAPLDITTAAPSNTPAAEDEIVTELKLPLSDEVVTLSMWQSFTSKTIASPEENECSKEISKRTNVKIKYQLASSSSASESFNLLVNSGDYPDIWQVFSGQYAGGLEKAVKDEVFINLEEYIRKWAPNYTARINANKEVYKGVHTDQGHIIGFNVIYDSEQPPFIGYIMNKGWLDELGMDTPTTIDEWHNALTAFKEQKNAAIPFLLEQTGYSVIWGGLSAAYDVIGTFYNENGTVKYGFIEDGFKEYLTEMITWIDEGLISKDFYANTENYQTLMGYGAQLADGKIGATHTLYALVPAYNGMAASKGQTLSLCAVPNPSLEKGGAVHFRQKSELVGQHIRALSPNLLSDEALLKVAIQYIDYRYSDEGALLSNYGIENESFTYDSEGKPVFTELMTKNPDGFTFTDMSEKYCDINAAFYFIWEREKFAIDPNAFAFCDVWKTNGCDYNMPATQMTEAENTEYANVYADIETFVSEAILSFMTQQKPMSEWDSFVAQVKSMGIDRCIEIRQAALDRYLAR